ncbi:MAG: WD40 repeat domain-containing protein, partial [Pseudomonadota bacterium]
YDGTSRLWRVLASVWSKKREEHGGADTAGLRADSAGLGNGHRFAATAVDFSPDGKMLASSGRDQTLRLWDVASGDEIRRFLGHRSAVEAMAFSPNGDLLASGGFDQTIHLWESSSGRLRKLLFGHTNWVRNVTFSASGGTLASASADRTIRIWDTATGAETKRLVGHREEVVDIAFSPDGRGLASASYDGTLRTWDLATGRATATFAGGAKMDSVLYSPDGRLLYSGGLDGSVRRWELASKHDRVLLQRQQSVPLSVPVSIAPSGRLLAISGGEEVLLLNAVDSTSTGAAGAAGAAGTDSGSTEVLLGRSTAEVLRTVFSPDGRLLAAAAVDGTVRIWDVDRLMPFWRAPVLLRWPPRVFTHRGWQWLDPVAGDASMPTASADWERAVEDRGVHGAASTDDKYLCLQVAGERLEQWALVADAQVGSEKVPGIKSVEALPGGRCASLARGEVRIHRQDETTLLGMTEAVVVASHADELLVVAGREVLVFDSREASNPQRSAREQGSPESSAQSSWSAKASYPVDAGVSAVGRVGDWLVLGYQQGQVELVPVRPGAPKPTHTFKGAPSCAVTRLIAGPAGTLVGGYANGTVIMWTLADGAALESAKLHGPIRHLFYAGDKLLAASEVGQYLVWDSSAFRQSYCELLRQVWRSIPVVWENGLAVSRRTIPEHSCAAGD